MGVMLSLVFTATFVTGMQDPLSDAVLTVKDAFTPNTKHMADTLKKMTTIADKNHCSFCKVYGGKRKVLRKCGMNWGQAHCERCKSTVCASPTPVKDQQRFLGYKNGYVFCSGLKENKHGQKVCQTCLPETGGVFKMRCTTCQQEFSTKEELVAHKTDYVACAISQYRLCRSHKHSGRRRLATWFTSRNPLIDRFIRESIRCQES